MEALINRLIDNELEDFEGLKIIGSIPVSEQIVNELAQQFLQDTVQKNEAPAPSKTAEDTSAPPTSNNAPDILGLIKKLDIHNFRITLENGKKELNIKSRVLTRLKHFL